MSANKKFCSCRQCTYKRGKYWSQGVIRRAAKGVRRRNNVKVKVIADPFEIMDALENSVSIPYLA